MVERPPYIQLLLLHDTYEEVLKAATAAPLANIPGPLLSLAQLLGYVTRVTCVVKFFSDASPGITLKFENKAATAAIMPGWPPKM